MISSNQGPERDKDSLRSHSKPEAKDASPRSQGLTLILYIHLHNFFAGHPPLLPSRQPQEGILQTSLFTGDICIAWKE